VYQAVYYCLDVVVVRVCLHTLALVLVSRFSRDAVCVQPVTPLVPFRQGFQSYTIVCLQQLTADRW